MFKTKLISLISFLVVSLVFPMAAPSARPSSAKAPVSFEQRLSSTDLLPQTEKQVAVGILIDNTGSMRSQFDVVLEFGKGIVERTYQDGPISLFVFKSEGVRSSGRALVSPGIEWSQNKDVLDSYIDSIFVIGGQTQLLDGISTIAAQLSSKVALDKAVFGDKSIFLITDGEDRSSQTSEKDLIKSLKENGIKVYAIGLVKELDKESGLMRKPVRPKAVSFLKEITKQTGGRVILQESGEPDVEKLLNELFTK